MRLEIVKNMGLRWTIYRTQYEIKKKFGYLEKFYPHVDLKDVYIGKSITKEDVSKKLKKNLSILNQSFKTSKHNEELLLEKAEKILNSKFNYFNYRNIEFKGWNYSPKTKKYAPVNQHWSKISDLNSDFGDIKWIWELSRFTFSYDLVRAYLVTKESKYVEEFWRLFEDFIEKNPLELGVNYKCSQEMSFRTNAWLFALNYFIDHPSSTELRVNKMIKSLAHYGNHILKHINFSVESVKNNHSISEAVTLTVLGNTLDFLPESEKFFKKGSKILEKEISWQIKPDGSFIQHSHNYHRLVLQNLSWYIMSMKSTNKKTSSEIIYKSNLSIDYFMRVIFRKGHVPNYGMNDGSYIMPLTENAYEDYRPVLQNLNFQINKNLLFQDDEVNDILLLLNKDADLSNLQVKDYHHKNYVINEYGGFHILERGKFKVFVKSKTYTERPLQADMNHIDIWYEDKCIFSDAGTYSYNDADKVLNYFNGTSSHNTVLINNKNQMIKGSRFIWFNWSKSKKPKIETKDDALEIIVELINYNEYKHLRKIIIGDRDVKIKDKIVNKKKLPTDIKLQWLTELNTNQIDDEVILDSNNFSLTVKADETPITKIYAGEQDNFRGWISSTYGEKHAANQIVSCIKSSNEEINIISIITKI